MLACTAVGWCCDMSSWEAVDVCLSPGPQLQHPADAAAAAAARLAAASAAAAMAPLNSCCRLRRGLIEVEDVDAAAVTLALPSASASLLEIDS